MAESGSVLRWSEARDGEPLPCWRTGEQRGRDGWIELWSSLRETALQSTAKPAEPRVCDVLILLLSRTPPHKCVRQSEGEKERTTEGE